MDLDAEALRLLEYMHRRGSATLGDNQDRIARALELTPAQLAEAIEKLCGQGLLHRESCEGNTFVLRITDKAIASLDERASPYRTCCWKLLDALAAAVVRTSVALRHVWQDRGSGPPSQGSPS